MLIYEGTTVDKYYKMLLNAENYEVNQGGSYANKLLIDSIKTIINNHPNMFNKNHPLNN